MRRGTASSSVDSSISLTPTERYEKAKAAGQETWSGSLGVYKPPCDCLECAEQYRSVDEQWSAIHCLYAGSMTGSEATALSRKFCTSLLVDLQVVRSFLQQHGELINKRWLKKSNTKRKSYLKQLRPNMYESQNSFLDIHMDKCTDAMSTRQYRETFLVPYMTIETLSKDGPKLLRMIYQRIAHTPEELVTFDNRQILSGWHAGVFEEKFNAGCITLYGKSYGKWSPFNKTDSTNPPHLPDALFLPTPIILSFRCSHVQLC